MAWQSTREAALHSRPSLEAKEQHGRALAAGGWALRLNNSAYNKTGCLGLSGAVAWYQDCDGTACWAGCSCSPQACMHVRRMLGAGAAQQNRGFLGSPKAAATEIKEGGGVLSERFPEHNSIKGGSKAIAAALRQHTAHGSSASRKESSYGYT